MSFMFTGKIVKLIFNSCVIYILVAGSAVFCHYKRRIRKEEKLFKAAAVNRIKGNTHAACYAFTLVGVNEAVLHTSAQSTSKFKYFFFRFVIINVYCKFIAADT